jgi:hypothetical protein
MVTLTMSHDLLFETDRFNLSEVHDHFINPCCFGEDVAVWLRGKLLETGLTVIEPGQEDWGWYIETELKGSNYFVGIGGNADESSANGNQGEWRIMIEKHRSAWEKVTGKNQMSDPDPLLKRIQDILEREPSFKNVRLET